MKKNIIILLFLCYVGEAYSFEDVHITRPKAEYEIEFINPAVKYIPFHMMISESHIENNQRIFFVSGSYAKGRAEIIEYDLQTKKEVKKLYSKKNDSEYIEEYSNNEAYIVWEVDRRDAQNNCLADIYVYIIATKETKKVAKNIVCSFPGGKRYPLTLKISPKYATWLEHKDNTSNIHILDFQTFETSIAVKLPYDDGLPFFDIRTFYVELQDNLLVYDNRQKKGKNKVGIFDIEKSNVIREFMLEKDILFHFNAAYNKKNNYIALYGQSKQLGGTVYAYNLRKNKRVNLFGLTKHALIYKDKIRTYDNYIVSNIQHNVTGLIIDHYHGEIYDIETGRQLRYLQTLDMYESKKYFANLKF